MTRTSCLRVFVVFLLVFLLALAWRHVYADEAYGYFQAARALAAGQPATLSPAPLYILLLTLAARLGLPLPPTALVLSALGWALAVTAWLEVGWRLDRPAFGVTAALLLALHPLLGRTLGLETGPALGLVSFSLLWAMGPRTSPQRTQGAQRFGAIFFAFFALSAVGMMPALAPWALLLGAGWVLWRRVRPSLAQIASGAALLAGLLALETALLGAWRDVRLLVPLTVAGQILIAAGLAAAMARTVRPLALLAAVVLCIGQANFLLQEWRLRPEDHLALYARVAQWARTHTLPTDIIGAPSPGLLGYLSERPVLALPSWNPARSAAECRSTVCSQARSEAECRETAGSQARSEAECRETAGSEARSIAECRETAGSQARSEAECRGVDDLLAWLDSHRPDFLLVPAALPWPLVQGQPWFQEHYRQVHRELNPYEPASSLQVYQYIPSPFDVGETVSSTLAFIPAPGQRLELTAYRLDSSRLVPGQSVHLTLYWRAATPLDQPLRLTLYLRPETGGSPRKWAETAAPGGLPTHLWTSGVTVTDRYLLSPPADLPVGRYHLELALHLPNGQPVCREAVCSQAQSAAECRTVCSQARSEAECRAIAGSQAQSAAECRTVCSQARSEAECRTPLASFYRPATVSTEAPQPDHSLRLTFGDGIELVGYDAPAWAVRGEPFRVALYWHAVCREARSAAECRTAVCSEARSEAECRAVGPIAADYKVFVHLLTADGRLLAQDDSEPVAWTYPTSRWQAGQYIMDEHWLTLPPDAPRGDGWLSVGLYDPVTGDRLPVYNEGGVRLPEDHAVLRSIRVY